MNDNLATIGAIYEAFGKGDIPTILDHLADDVRWEEWADNTAQKAGVPWMQARHGKAGALEFFQVMGDRLQVTEVSVLSLMAGGNQVAVEFVIACDVKGTGRRYRDEELHLWTLNEDGKVTRLRHYTDTAKHIEAAQGGASTQDE
jgi:ketosteroid isomerase-like protein